MARGDTKLERQDTADDGYNDVTIAEILENPEVTKAVNTAVSAWANNQPELVKLRFRALHLNIAFSAFVLIIIGTLGYFGVVSKDVTGSLLGALIGYWYGRYQGKN